MDTPKGELVLITQRSASCAGCALRPLCLPHWVDEAHQSQFESIIQHSQPITRGTVLFQQGTAVRAAYIVRAGAMKTVSVLSDGQSQVTGFYLPGEIVGLDSIGGGHYQSTAIALESTAVCAISASGLMSLARDINSVQRHILELMGRQIQASHELMHQIKHLPCEQRLAIFLMDIGARYKRRRLSDVDFRLPMLRSDLANYIGAAEETVSRVFTRFHEQGILSVNSKLVKITNRERLQTVANLAA